MQNLITSKNGIMTSEGYPKISPLPFNKQSCGDDKNLKLSKNLKKNVWQRNLAENKFFLAYALRITKFNLKLTKRVAEAV